MVVVVVAVVAVAAVVAAVVVVICNSNIFNSTWVLAKQNIISVTLDLELMSSNIICSNPISHY